MTKSISDLVEKFSHNLDEYKNPKYNETSVRIEFVNPFWEALGWDVLNSNGYALAFRDVIHEDEVRVGHTTKAPDYSFRIGGKRIFFLETKKPSVDLKNDPAPAFQLRRYAYSAKLPVSLLTDFEEFIVYDTTLKPAISDKPHVGRMLYYRFEEYLENWEFIQSVFSKEAVKRGDFHRFIQDKQGKKPRAEIDRDFLNDLDNLRILLARNIALRNPDLSDRELNFAVQMTIDRLIFLRMCEDRGIEIQHTLQALLNGERVYSRLVEIYYRADERYNSGLFHFSAKDGANPDTITPTLSIDDKLLIDIIKKLYYPDCPYEFSVLPVEVLGNAYEQFLGKRISLTAGHHARIEEKPEVRKAGGVYYTPKYIVDYIVKNTVGKLLENQTPQQVGGLRILDPACGSGSFLLGAFQYLMDWHLDYYQKEFEKTGKVPHCLLDNGKRKRKSTVQAIFQGKGDNWFLSTYEKKRILLNNLYGVDIDANAVEVTKLSLLLKVLENENSETLTRQLGIWHERALPNLSQNIKCGNSLIGPDYYDSQQTALFDEEEALRINVFDWESEFRAIFDQGGFDAVIGNPPYGFHQIHSEMIKPYLKEKFSAAFGSYEHYFLFYEKSINLLKRNGFHGFIVPVTWLTIPSAHSLRIFILENTWIREILWMSSLVFENAQVNTLVSIIQKASPKQVIAKIYDIPDLSLPPHEERLYEQQKFVDLNYFIPIFETSKDQTLIEKLVSNSKPLKDYCRPCSGYNPYEVGKGKDPKGGFQTKETIVNKPYHSNKQLGPEWKPEIVGRDLGRYILNITGERWIKYGPWLAAQRNPENFLGKRILVQEITGGSKRRIIAIFYDGELYHSRDVIPIKIENEVPHPYYLLGLINSWLITWYHHRRNPKAQKALFPKVLVSDLSNLPIRTINFDNPADKAQHDRMITLVEQMLDLHKKLSETRDPRSREQLQRRIDATDKQIDRLVYELYDLTEEEIKVVEGKE